MVKRNNRIFTRAVILAGVILMSHFPVFNPETLAQDCLDIADTPLISESASSSANFFFLIDDSGSMDWEFVVNDPNAGETNGKWPYGNATVAYLYDNVDNNYTDNTNGRILGETDTRQKWKATFSEYNYLYYDPKIYYEPWITSTGEPMANADPNRPRSRPATSSFTGTDDRWYTNLDDEWCVFPAGGEGIIVDNDDDGFTRGSFARRDSPDWYWDFYGDSLHRYMNNATRTAEWEHRFTSDDAGSYHVEVWVGCTNVARGFAADRSADYTVEYSGGTLNTTLDQRGSAPDDPNDPTRGCGKWIRITTDPLPFDAGFTGEVTVTRMRNAPDREDVTIADAIRFVTEEQISQQRDDIRVPISHYYTWHDANEDEVRNDGEIYLVMLNSDDTVDYYRMDTIPSDGIPAFESFTEVDEAAVPASCRADAFRTRNGYEGPEGLSARQNFANWYQYYRRRFMTSIYAISKAINEFSGVRIGIGGINALLPNSPAEQDNGIGIVEPVTPVRLDGQDNSAELLRSLFNYDHIARYMSTPMRQGYHEAAQYFDVEDGNGPQDKLGPSPLTLYEGAECGLNFIIAFTDGYYNGRAAGHNPDADQEEVYAENGEQISGCEPFESRATNSFADLVMSYYAWDIADNIDNDVPIYLGTPPDYVTWQHIVTYTVTFGVFGSLNPDDYDLYGSSPVYPAWPDNLNRDAYLIDDMYHGAVNGRGEFFAAKNPQDLIDAFETIADRINDRIGAGARATSNTSELVSGAMLFRVEYNAIGWSGKLSAQNLNTDQGNLLGDVSWEAHTLLNTMVEDNGHASRNIATYSGTLGVAFDWAGIGSANRESLMYREVTDAGLSGTDLVDYLRGDKTHEVRNGGIFRDRMTSETEGGAIATPFTLGDIVHSSPTHDPETNTVYVGANDGFLHAFDGTSGGELFAYAPSFVMENMKLLSQPGYSHRFLVNETPVVRNIGDMTMLVSGLGKGGKGIFCLDVTDPAANTRANAHDWVKWEFPNTQTFSSDVADMGYSFCQPYIVKTRLDQPWVVIFPNGYASPGGEAVLFIVDATTGELVRKIETGHGGCNGLSNIIVTDPDANQIADYVYAGDLKGNLWKFDLTDEDPNEWRVAYGNPGDPKPLFTASGPAGEPQPITAKPDAMDHCDVSKPGYIIVFGTGKFLGLPDIGSGPEATRQQTVYGVWDYGDDDDDNEYLGTFVRDSTPMVSAGLNMVEQSITIDGDSGSATCNEPCWDTEEDDDTDQDPNPNPDSNTTGCTDDEDRSVAANAGWFLDLPMNGERVVFDVMIIEGAAYILSIAPDVSGRPCAEGGVSGVYIINACDGGCRLPVDNEISSSGVLTDTYDYDSSRDVFDRHGEPLAIDPGAGGGNPGGDTPHATTGAPNVTVGNAGVGGTVFYDPATGQYLYVVTEAGGGIARPVPALAQKTGLIYWRVLD